MRICSDVLEPVGSPAVPSQLGGVSNLPLRVVRSLSITV